MYGVIKSISTLQKTISTAIALFLLLVWTAEAKTNSFSVEGLEQETGYYSIEFKGRILGYVRYNIQKDVLEDERSVYRIDSETIMKMAFFGMPKDRHFHSTLLFDSADGRPISYKRTIDYGKILEAIECRWEGQRLSLKITLNDQILENREWIWDKEKFILDDNNFVHWMLFFRSLESPQLRQLNSKVFVPREGVLVDISLSGEGMDEIEIEDRKYSCFVERVRVQDQRALAWIDKRNNRLVKLEIPEQDMVVKVAGPEVVDAAQRVEVGKDFFYPAKIEANLWDDISCLKVKVKAEIFGEVLDRSWLNSHRQRYRDKVGKNAIDGVFKIKPREYTGKKAPVFPRQSFKASQFDKYLRPEIGVESDDPQIKKRAEEITKGSSDCWEAVVRIASWVYKNIRYEALMQGSAKSVLLSRLGDSGEKSKLTVAMCRAMGIPARLVGGIVYTPIAGGGFTPHCWAEVYMRKAGWIPIDPTMDQYSKVDATHIRLCSKGTLSSFQIKVVDFSLRKRSMARGSRLDLRRYVGRKKTYRFVVDNVTVGYNTSCVMEQDRIYFQDRKTYLLESNLNLDGLKVGGNYKAEVRAKLYLTPEEGLPVLYRYQSLIDEKERKAECRFEGDKVYVKVRTQTRPEQEVPIIEGSYCLDKDMIGQWALLCNKLSLEIGKKVYIAAFVPRYMTPALVIMDVRRKEMVEWNSQMHQVYICDVLPLREVFWITTEDRELIRIDDPREKLRIELTVDEEPS